MADARRELLADLLLGTDTALEWGSGTSTAWLSHKTKSIVSVEHDRGWYERVRSQLAAEGADPGSVRLESIEPHNDPSASPYVRVVDEFEDGELDFCLVDGMHRAACAHAVLGKLSSGGVLVVDDAQAVLDHESTSPHSRYGLGPVDAEWASFAGLVDRWRLMWTSDGYSDTAFWIKP